ncbi:DoxX family protein [Pseudonocardia sp. CA-107938]|uniref:DoxX family protein n=1 Tax=Pseudonocardia sp. CA-107938 TaxID=3240021 RepID=UPI003D92D697
MSIGYWIAAGPLALFFLYAGAMKLVRSREQLEPMMGWVDTVPMAGVRALGVVEVLGALGLVLPRLTGIAPVLTLAAATGLLVLQVLAAAFHLSRRETSDIWLNVVLIVIAAIAAGTDLMSR